MLISDILSSWACLLVWMTLGLSFFHHWAEAWNCCYHSFQSNRISTSPESNVYFSEKSDLPFYSKRKFYTGYTSMNYKSRPFWQFHKQGHVVRWKGIIENWQARYVSFMNWNLELQNKSCYLFRWWFYISISFKWRFLKCVDLGLLQVSKRESWRSTFIPTLR